VDTSKSCLAASEVAPAVGLLRQMVQKSDISGRGLT